MSVVMLRYNTKTNRKKEIRNYVYWCRLGCGKLKAPIRQKKEVTTACCWGILLRFEVPKRKHER